VPGCGKRLGTTKGKQTTLLPAMFFLELRAQFAALLLALAFEPGSGVRLVLVFFLTQTAVFVSESRRVGTYGSPDHFTCRERCEEERRFGHIGRSV
jgi:hypothetical protein